MFFIHTLVLKIGIPVVVVLMVVAHVIRRKIKYKGGTKAANTGFVKNLDIYKKKKRMFKFVSFVMEACIVASLFSSLVLVARPALKETVNNGTKKRDIFLCMDVSYSIYDLNYDLVESLQGVVAGLDGDRFGICIFNTSTVLYVPMTDDYDFINKKLEELKEYFKLQKEFMSKFYNNESGYIQYSDDQLTEYQELQEKLDFFDAGTLVNNYQKGSSLIGEGLASCMYSFPRLEDEDRTRIIIMSTDNAEEELKTPLVELDEAASLCKKNHIKVFGLFPNREIWSGLNTSDYDTDMNDFQQAVESTSGKFYKQSETLTVEDIVKDIERIEALEVEEVTTTKINDQPKIPVIILFSSIAIMLVIGLVMRI